MTFRIGNGSCGGGPTPFGYSEIHEKACGAVGRDLAGDRRGRGGPAGLLWLVAAELCGGGDGCCHGRGRTDELPRCQPQGQVPFAAALGLSLTWLPVLFANIGAMVIEDLRSLRLAAESARGNRTRPQSLLKASLTFSPASLRLLLVWSIWPSRSICSLSVALPSCSLAAPFVSSFLFFSLSVQPITGLPSRQVHQWRVGARWTIVHARRRRHPSVR